MKRSIQALTLGLFVIVFATGPSNPPSGGGCSSSPATKAEVGAPSAPASTPQNQVRRDPPPLMAPGEKLPTVKPMTLKHDSGVIFYFESDGQHVAAINPDGSILWHKNPIAERGIKGRFPGTRRPHS